jgi:nucleoid-associated protein YgaU
VVKSGENYSKIAQAIYGSSKYYLDIEQANPNIDPTRLKPGTTINLPSIDTAKTTVAAAPAAGGAVAPQQESAQQQPALDPKTQYKVQPNDSLYTISLRLYGKADRVEKIYELNRTTIGDDMARLKVGTVLKLPETPTQGAAPAQSQGSVATSR